MGTRKKPAFVDGAALLARKMKGRNFRAAFFERTFVREVAAAVLKMREAAGLTQAQLAKAIGSTQSVVARLERGDVRRQPRAELLHRIAQACGVGFQVRFIARPRRNAPVVEYKAA
jgi:ribosome-binding protein aMBF1 (putative translation factor)